jgi:hypothetical protein
MFRQNATRRGDRVAKSTLVCRVGTVMTVHHGVTWCNHPPDNWETMENHGKPWQTMEIHGKLHSFEAAPFSFCRADHISGSRISAKFLINCHQLSIP